MSFYAKAVWTCDFCGKKHKVVTEEPLMEGEWDDALYLPENWFRNTNSGGHFCSDECIENWIRDNEGEEEAEHFKNSIWF